MRRREFVALIGGAGAAWSVFARAAVIVDYFSMLQFIVFNLAFAATVLHPTEMLHSRANLAEAASMGGFFFMTRPNGDAPSIAQSPRQARCQAQSKSNVEANFETQGMAPGLPRSTYLFAFVKLNKFQ